VELGRYRLEEQVGQGGMAVVWRGWDTQLRRTVAVKVLHAHLHSREEIRKRFDREAHAVARLHHPYILDVYDFSGPQAQPSYLVTEFIRGQTLRTFADEHPFDPPELAAACLLPIAEALQHAHAAGVVHRDLKPENIMVRDDGVVKLTDFGIAALLDPDEKFTVTGSILGSPSHLAPETIEGKPADPRADLFSFGTIFYWLSCGKLPYQGTSPAALLRSILDGTRLDPRAVRPSISDGQARIIARCLENDPAKRYQSAAEVKLELTQLLRDSGIDDPVRELAAFVRAPQAHAANVRARLVARSLGAGRLTTFGRITLPIIKGGIISGAVLAFITSFDQFPISRGDPAGSGDGGRGAGCAREDCGRAQRTAAGRGSQHEDRSAARRNCQRPDLREQPQAHGPPAGEAGGGAGCEAACPPACAGHHR